MYELSLLSPSLTKESFDLANRLPCLQRQLYNTHFGVSSIIAVCSLDCPSLSDQFI